jgi:hypothetical protein
LTLLPFFNQSKCFIVGAMPGLFGIVSIRKVKGLLSCCDL